MRLALFTLLLLLAAVLPGQAQQTEVHYLSGTDKDNTVDWEFFVTGGRNSGRWTTIPVPSNWELHGFGTYNYGHADPRATEQGRYRYRFDVPAAWQNQNVQIVFGGSMTDTEVRINGQLAGPKHQGGFYQFRYDVTNLLAYGQENLLEVTVDKESSNASVNEAERQADFWIFGGIYRPVLLEIRPAEHIQRIALDAKADGSFLANVYINGINTADRVTGQIFTLEGVPVGEPFSELVTARQDLVTLTTNISNPATWTPESPNLYQVQVTLQRSETPIHQVSEKFGFRTVELRPRDGIYVNGVKVHLKGVNRHSFWPDAGRVTSREISIMDVNLIKDMNMNAVRMSHYPPDEHFLDVCDSLGLFVLDELTGWQDAYETEIGEKLVRELVIRDVNHPSVIFWDNGNEGGFNYDLVDDFALYDPQKRIVIHPWENREGLINTTHYRTYNCCTGKFFNGPDLFMPTEFLHGLYDGGHGAGLNDMWDKMLGNPLASGAFLWALADEGIVRTDSNGILDTDGNHAPDGIVGPYREKEASFYTIKEIWSPVHIPMKSLTQHFDGQLPVENRYYYTNLNQVTFDWRLVDFEKPGSNSAGHNVAIQGRAASPSVEPWSRGTITLDLPGNWGNHDALYVTATDPHGREVETWSWMIKSPSDLQPEFVTAASGQVTGFESDSLITARTGSTVVWFDKSTGHIVEVNKNGTTISLTNGPRIIEGTAELTELNHYADGSDYVIEAAYDGNLKIVRWRLMPGGWLQLEYRYENPGQHDFLGISFDYPENQVTGLKWLGRGPFRVWKNRMRGMEFDVWEKSYNNTRTGVDWEYPEFKGVHANLYWAVIETREQPITVVSATDDLFLRILTPQDGPNPGHASVAFPDGDLSFLHGIAPIGTKFNTAFNLGPEGAPNEAAREHRTQNMGAYEATLYFYFGETPAVSTN